MLQVQNFSLIRSVCASTEKKLYKPSELDIYYEREENVQEINSSKQHPTLLHENVSSLRKMITKSFSGFLTTHEKISNLFTFTEDKLTGIYSNAVDDPYSLLIPGSVILATIGGAAAAGRGKRPIRRFFYGSLFGTTAAIVTHPERALDIATTGYYHTTGSLASLWHSYSTPAETITEKIENESVINQVDEPIEKNTMEEVIDDFVSQSNETNVDDLVNEFIEIETVQEKLESIASSNDTSTVINSAKETDETSLSSDDSRDFVVIDESEASSDSETIQGDYGQSNPEDNDMYSTRSS